MALGLRAGAAHGQRGAAARAEVARDGQALAARALAESGEGSFDEFRTRVHNALTDLRRIDRSSRDFWMGEHGDVVIGDVFANPDDLDRLAPEWERKFAGDLLKVRAASLLC